MKNFKKIIVCLLVLAALAVGVVVTTIADDEQVEYTGTMSNMNYQLYVISTTGDINVKEEKLDAAYEYYKTIDPASEGYGEIPAQLYKYNKDIVKYYLQASSNATDVTVKKNNLFAAQDRLTAHPLDEEDEDNEAINAQIAESSLSMITSSLGEAANAEDAMHACAKIREINALVKKFPPNPDAEGYEEFRESYDFAIAKRDALVAEAKALIESNISVNEYNNKTFIFKNDFDNPGTPLSASNLSKDFAGVETDPVTGNVYYTIRSRDNSGDNHIQHKLAVVAKQSPIVFEFDVTTFGELTPNFHFRSFSLLDRAGERVYPQYFDTDGSRIIIPGSVDKTTVGEEKYADVLNNFIVPGEWTHIAFVFHNDTCDIDLYVDYVKVGVYHSIPSKPTCTFDLNGLYLGFSTDRGEVSFDNFMIYEGSVPRTHDKTDNMSDADLFNFYASIFSNTEAPVTARIEAYNKATDKLSLFWDAAANEGAGAYLTDDEKIVASVDAYLDFDLEQIMLDYRKSNLEKYTALANELLKIERNPETLEDRRAAAELVDKHVAQCAGEIYPGDNGEYAILVARVADANTKIAADDVIIDFCNTINRFLGAAAPDAMKKLYVTLQEKAPSLDTTLLEDENYTNFQQAYEVYLDIPNRIDIAVRNKNSKDFIGYFGQIAEYDTEEEWIANYDKIERYTVILRDLVFQDMFSADYEGLEEAFAAYAPIEEYFFAQLQLEHIAYIDGVIKAFEATDSYVERMGFCALIKNYLEKNELVIDADNEDIAALVAKYEIYDAETSVQEGEYSKVLSQNTTYFINIMKNLETLSGYRERRDIIDFATTYYYAMNVGTVEAQNAVKIYEKVVEELKVIEHASAQVIASAIAYSVAETEDEKFAALVNCCRYVNDATTDIDGVAVSLEEYKAAYTAYNATINPANTELSEATKVVGAVRDVCGVAPIVAVILSKIYW